MCLFRRTPTSCSTSCRINNYEWRYLFMSVFLTNSKWKITEFAAKALVRNGVNIVAGDTSSPFFKFYSTARLVNYPSPVSDEFVQSLYNIVEHSDIDVLFPMSNDVVIKLAEHKHMFQEICEVPIPNYNILLKAFDKLQTAMCAERANIPIPKTYFFDNRDELRIFSEDADYPLIIKPRFGGGASVFLFKVNSKNELIRAFDTITNKYGPPIIQEYIPGGSGQMHMVNVLFNKKSDPLVVFTAQKIREYPISGGITTCGVSTHNPELIRYATKLFSQLGWYGVAEAEFKVDSRDGKYKLIEINPRFWQYLQLPIACGVNFPYLLYKTALEEDVECLTSYKIGLKYINPLKDLLSVPLNLYKYNFNTNVVREMVDSYRGEKTYSVHNWGWGGSHENID